MPVLTCSDLSLGYDGAEIVSGLSFSVSRGDYLCIVGENGSGKSTLLKALLGFVSPMSGSVVWEGGRGPTGYLPQQTQVQRDFPASVWEVVLSGCQGRRGAGPFYKKSDRELARSALERLDALHLRKRCYRELSGGQQQRVLLARALCAADDLLILDEPVTGLDPEAAAGMYDVIRSLNRDDGITVIMVTHDIRSVTAFATHVLHLGDETFFGTAREYASSPLGRRFIPEEGGKRDA